MTEMQNQNKRTPKILVVGSKGHPREVKCYNWTEIEKIPNVADQDVVIIDMTTLSQDTLEEIVGIPSHFMSDYFLELFNSDGKVFVIATPPIKATKSGIDNYCWNPFKIDFVKEGGDTVENVSPRFQRYFNNVKNWQFTMNPTSPTPGTIALAQNRYRKALGILIKSRTKGMNGAFCFLPSPTEISSKSAIDILLEDFFDIRISEATEPDWVKDMKVPGESEIEGRVSKGIERIKEEKNKIEKAKRELRDITKFRKLLYTEGGELEHIVRETFRELGATVIEPKEKNKEDGWIETKFGKGVLEIKKSNKSASRKHTRQLDDWVGNCIANDEECKGILVINHYGDNSLKDRENPFPDDVKKHAEKARPGNPFCLLTTIELFNAFCAFKKGEISSDEIFKKIFDANGEECKII